MLPGYTHIIDGQTATGTIGFHRKCPSRLLIFEPVEPVDDIRNKVLVIAKYPHNHPRHPHVKPTLEEKELLEKCTKASRAARITPKVRDSASTAEVLGGRKWEEALPSMIDNPRLQRLIKGLNQTRYPKGLNWDGKSAGSAIYSFYDQKF